MVPYRIDSPATPRQALLKSPTRRQLLQGGAALAAGSLLPGCNHVTAPGSAIAAVTANPQPVPASPITQGTVMVAATAAGAIGSQYVGLSYEKSTMYTQLWGTTVNGVVTPNAALVYLFKLLGVTVLRIGGNSVDKNVWTPNGKGLTSGQIAPQDLSALAAFVKAVGCQCLYGVNLGGAATGAQTTTLAAQEVADAVSVFNDGANSSLLGIEIGNECDLYGTSYYTTGWTLTQFEALWLQYRAAILAANPGVTITGPASGGNISSWTVPFSQAEAANIALLTQHYYRGDGSSPNSTAQLLISADTTLVSDLAILQTAAAAAKVPYRISECNSFYNGGAGGVSNSYASSLWIIDFLFNCAQGGAQGVNFHGGGNSTGYTPIADSASSTANTIVGARPEYYGILMTSAAGPGTLLATTVAAASLNVTAYTVQNQFGGLAVMIVNKDPLQNVQMAVTLPQTASSARAVVMTQSTSGAAPSLSATSGVMIQGQQVNASGTTFAYTAASPYTITPSGNSLTVYVPALSAVLVQIGD